MNAHFPQNEIARAEAYNIGKTFEAVSVLLLWLLCCGFTSTLNI